MNEKEAIEVLRQVYGDGKPWVFVQTAVEIAASAEMVEGSLRQLIGRGDQKKKWQVPFIQVEEWLSWYRRHREVRSAAWFGATGKTLDEVFANCDRELTQEENEYLVRLFLGVPFPPDKPTLRAMLKGTATDADEGHTQLDQFTESQAGQFYWSVWFPCWMLHRTLPGNLLRKARLGDDDALDKLLRLDKSVIFDPGIKQRWHEVMKLGTVRDRQRFKRAMADGPKGKVTKKFVRIGLAGMISQMAKLFYCEVTAPEIRELFDSIARVRRNAADLHLPVGTNLTRAIHRARDWPALSHPDMK